MSCATVDCEARRAVVSTPISSEPAPRQRHARAPACTHARAPPQPPLCHCPRRRRRRRRHGHAAAKRSRAVSVEDSFTNSSILARGVDELKCTTHGWPSRPWSTLNACYETDCRHVALSCHLDAVDGHGEAHAGLRYGRWPRLA